MSGKAIREARHRPGVYVMPYVVLRIACCARQPLVLRRDVPYDNPARSGGAP